MTHAGIVDRPGARRLSHDLSRARIGRVDVRKVYDTAEPSTVTFTPLELDPFELRYSFWHGVDEELPDDHPRKWAWFLACPPAAIPRDSPDLVVEWTPEHERTLASNKYAYQRYAQGLLNGRVRKAFEARAAMLTLRVDDHRRESAGSLPDSHLVAFVHTVEMWREAGYNLEETALELGMSYRTLARRRAEAKRRGLASVDG